MIEKKLLFSLFLVLLLLVAGFSQGRASTARVDYGVVTRPFENATTLSLGLTTQDSIMDFYLYGELVKLQIPGWELDLYRQLDIRATADFGWFKSYIEWDDAWLHGVTVLRSQQTDLGLVELDVGNVWDIRNGSTVQEFVLHWKLPFDLLSVNLNATLRLADYQTIKRKSLEITFTGSFGVRHDIITTSIQGNVFCDENSNGQYGRNERGAPNVVVQLKSDGKIIKRVGTVATGFFSFGQLPPGSYVLQIQTNTLPDNYVLVSGRQLVIGLQQGDIHQVNIAIEENEVPEKGTFKAELG